MTQIQVVDYDAGWPSQFESLRQRIQPAVDGIATAIEHVGSTSVPGLAAKPIIDIDVVVSAKEDVPRAIEALGTLGYRHRGDLGVEGREAFQHPAGDLAHHLYLCYEGSLGLRNHLAVRDFLRANATFVDRYGSLKKRLARLFPDDIDAYIDGKTDMLLEILRHSTLAADDLARIEAANRTSE